jgi:hypothetical protein
MKYFHKLASFAAGAAMLATAGFTHVALAQDVGGDFATLGKEAGFGTKTIYETVGSIIRVALGVVGLIAILLVIFGGFKWMTSGGSEEKVDEAKKILYSGIIGLVIILSAYALSSFVLKTLTTATGTTIGG